MEKRTCMLKRSFGFYLHVAVIISAATQISSIEACTKNQYKKVTLSGTKCIDCPRCPHGYGPLIQCGTSILANATIMCQQCIKGVTYSDEYDYEQCQSCGVCSEDQAMTQCTIESNTICHHNCKSKNNYYEQSSDDCQKCSWCCGDGNDIVQDECLKKGMPRQQSCTVHRKKDCTVATTAKPTIHVKHTVMNLTTHQPTTATSIVDNISGFDPTTKLKTSEAESKKEGTDHVKQSALTIVAIVLGVVIGILALLCIIVARILYKKQNNYQGCQLQCGNGPNSSHSIEMVENGAECQPATEGSPLIEQVDLGEPTASSLPVDTLSPNQTGNTRGLQAPIQDPGNVPCDDQIIGADIKLFQWLDKNYEVKDDICDMLDTQKSFAAVARHFQLDSIRIRKLEERYAGDHPTEDVLEYIQRAFDPNLVIATFIACTDKIGRKDVSDVLKRALAQD